MHLLRHSLSFFRMRIIKDLCTPYLFILITVLVYTYRCLRHCFIDDLYSCFHIMDLFISGLWIAEHLIFFSCHYNFPAFFLQSFFNFSGDLKIDILFFCLIHTDLSRIIPAVPAVKNDYLIFRCYISAGYKFLQILTEQHKYRQKK